MMISDTSDLTKLLIFQDRSDFLNAKITNLSQELVTGRLANLGQDRTAHIPRIQYLEHQFEVISAYETVQQDANSYFDQVDLSIEKMQKQVQDVGQTLFQSIGSNAQTPIAKTEKLTLTLTLFENLISALNRNSPSGFLFSGSKTTQAPFPKAKDIVDQIKSFSSGSVSKAELVDKLDEWFDGPSSIFQREIYKGSQTGIKSFQISPDMSAQLELRANDLRFRNLLKSAALAVVATTGTISKNEQKNALEFAAEGLLSANDVLIEIRAGLGSLKEQIENQATHDIAQLESFKQSYNDLTNADPYETATDLKSAENQLERLYLLTSQLTKLSFMDFFE